MGAVCSQKRLARPGERRCGSTQYGGMQSSINMNICGLLTEKGQEVPLKSVEVDVKVKGHIATVTSVLRYVNEEKLPVEAVFVFPLPAEASLCHFSAKIANEEVVGEVQEKQKAREMYDDAISSGKRAFLLEESGESPDVFQLCVGSLPPKESAAVTLIYVIELTAEADHALRFCLPAVLNPRYGPTNIDSANVPQVKGVPSRLVPYTLSLSVVITSPIPISKVESNCSLGPLTYLNTAHTQAKVSLSPGHKFDRDVELLLYYQDAHQPTAIVEAGLKNAKPGSLMADPVVMLSLCPEFPAEVVSSCGKRGEFIFLMDQSGSMAGSSIRSARETLLLLLKSLPLGCYFNIFGFGSFFQSFFTESVEYTQETMEKAMEKVEAMEANMQGTEILKPLKHIYGQAYLPNHPRQLFVFTDGEVWNTKEILDLVRTHSLSHRCFTFGIGKGASTALITGMAKEGRGTAQFITGSDRLQLKVMQSLSFALQPSVVDISVKWTVPDGMSVITLTPPLNVLFQGQRALLYAQLTGQSSGNNEGTVTLHYSLAENPVTNQLSFCLKPSEDTGLAVHRLAARAVIQSLEKEERQSKDDSVREKVVELSVQAGVSSSFTAFISVHKGSGQPVKGPLVKRTVPVAQGSYVETDGAPSFRARRARGARLRSLKAQTTDVETDGAPSFRARRARGAPIRFLKAQTTDVEPDGSPSFMAWNARGFLETDGGFPKEQAASPVQKDPYLKLVSLQKAAGFWELRTELLGVFSKTEEELAKQRPAQVDDAVWATVLALIWLHGFRAADQEEWKFIAMKATSWIQSQKVGNLAECVQAGNALLGCQVKEDCLGF
ncbi:von Willebrand factor A domain-containing protein 5A isoform X12 [Astyanax mexicanus]|uniref:von Willebrand factor A domain-containing protein 5A isoform X12 n=1 Tax=Astyanax mexicanus TaxID=7994 RepID=UPI0020CB61F2|nr:von Willebrand factor A domain-containing protein 5A isoform X12 [Astyanax mexicanus]